MMIAWTLLTLILMVSNSNGFLNGKPGKARQGGFDAGAGFNKLGEFVVPGKMLRKIFVQKQIQFQIFYSIKNVPIPMSICHKTVDFTTIPFVTILCGSNFFFKCRGS